MSLCFATYDDVVIEFTEKRVPPNVLEMTSKKKQIPVISKLIYIVLRPMKSIIVPMHVSTFIISIEVNG